MAVGSPLPISRRTTMLPEEAEIYEGNAAISNLGLDAMAGRGGQANSVDWSRKRMQRLSDWDEDAIPAKKQAVRPKPFTGKSPWKKWFGRWCEDVESNVWNEQQCLGSLKECLRDGPGESALWAFEDHGDGSLDCLVEIAAWICGPLNNADPTIELEVRKQEKGEGHRQFGMVLRQLANEAFEGISPSEPWLVRKLSTLFIDGLEDTSLSIELSTLWKTDMSLNDLFSLADDCTRKRVLLKTRVSAPVRREEDSRNVEAAGATRESSDPSTDTVAAVTTFPGRGRGQARGRGRASYNSTQDSKKDVVTGLLTLPDMLNSIKQVVETVLTKTPVQNRRPPVGTDKKLKPGEGNCHKCKQPGHWARQCPMETIAAVDEEPMEVYEDAESQPPSAGN